MRDPYMFKAGEGMYLRTSNCSDPTAWNPWGDYSATQVDPVDDISIWTIQQYSLPPGSPTLGTGCTGQCGTWWAKVGPLSPVLHLFLPLIMR